MNLWKTLSVAAALLVLSGQAAAKQGGLCYSKAFHPQAVLTCDHLGNVTMKDIYTKGWRVAAVWTYTVGQNVLTYLAIEEQ